MNVKHRRELFSQFPEIKLKAKVVVEGFRFLSRIDVFNGMDERDFLKRVDETVKFFQDVFKQKGLTNEQIRDVLKEIQRLLPKLKAEDYVFSTYAIREKLFKKVRAVLLNLLSVPRRTLTEKLKDREPGK